MPDYLSAIDAANLLGVSESYIRKRIKSKALPAKKVRGRWGILRSDLDGLSGLDEPDEPDEPPALSAEPDVADEPGSRAEPHEPDKPSEPAVPPEWREDLLAQVARLEEDKVAGAEREAVLREDLGLRIEASKVRVIDLERELTVRDSRMVDLQAKQESEVTELRGQVAVLEAKVREVLERSQDNLEKGQDEALQLANRIADLVDRQQEAEARIHELQPVAEQVPMLQAAVEEKDATLSQREQALQDTEQELGNMRQDIDAIASRPVTGPVFRLLTKGRLRR